MNLVRSVRLADCFATNSGRREPDDRPDALHEAGSEFFWPLISGASATTIAWSTLSFSASNKDRGESIQRVFAINSKSAWLRLAGLFVPIALIGSCAIGPRVTRTSSDEAIDVSGYRYRQSDGLERIDRRLPRPRSGRRMATRDRSKADCDRRFGSKPIERSHQTGERPPD